MGFWGYSIVYMAWVNPAHTEFHCTRCPTCCESVLWYPSVLRENWPSIQCAIYNRKRGASFLLPAIAAAAAGNDNTAYSSSPCGKPWLIFHTYRISTFLWTHRDNSTRLYTDKCWSNQPSNSPTHLSFCRQFIPGINTTRTASFWPTCSCRRHLQSISNRMIDGCHDNNCNFRSKICNARGNSKNLVDRHWALQTIALALLGT